MRPSDFLAAGFNLSESVLRNCFDSGAFQRGRRYFAQERVANLKIKQLDEGNWQLTANVKGSRRSPYRVNAYFYADEPALPETYCSCPVEFDCKHGVAVLLALAQQMGASGKGEDPTLDKWLAQLGQRLQGASPGARDRVRYQLSPARDKSGRAGVQLTIRRQTLGVRGGWTKGRLIGPDNLRYDHRGEFTDATDRRISTLLRASLPDYSYDREPVPETPALAPLLAELADSGRCYWDDSPEPLAPGEARPLSLSWRRKGKQYKLQAQLAGEALSGPLYLVESGRPVYVDPRSGQLGPVATDLPGEALALLASAPPVPERRAAAIGDQLARLAPPHILPPPLALERVQLEDAQPQPRLHLYLDEMFGTLGRLRMAYAGRETALLPYQAHASWVEGGKQYQVLRSEERESAAAERLGDNTPLKQITRGDDLCFAFPTSYRDGVEQDSLPRWLQLAATLFPELEKEGWHISWGEELDCTLLRADDWAAEIEEGSGNDWFEFSLGIQVGDERIDLRPVLPELIAAAPPLAQLEEQPQALVLPLEDNRYLQLPGEILLPLLRTLFALFDNPQQAADGRLTRVQALAAAVSSAPLQWRGGEDLQRTARLLAKPLEPRNAAAGFRGELRGYQQEGLAWMQRLRQLGLGGVLADDMGLGKTVQVLALLHAEKRGRRLDRPALIVAPTSLLGNWLREAERFAPTLSTLVWHGPDRHGDEDPFAAHDLVITTYGLLVRDGELIAAQPWHYAVLDEAQQIKNPRSKAAHQVAELDARHRLCLSGTPMENHLGELWSLFNFTIPGYLGEAEQFRRAYRTPIEQHGDGERAQLLARRVAPFLLRRTKDQVAAELPAKVEMTRTVPLAPKQADLYENLRLAMDKRVRKALSSKGLARSHITVLDALLKLRQVCCDPLLLPADLGGRQAPSAKRDYFRELVEELVSENRRTLVFSQFTSMLALLEQTLQEAGIPSLKLTGRTRKREQVIDAFRAGEAPVFLISLKAGGVGLNLVEADTVIHYDPWWNPAVENQATDRAHRIGQDKTVFVYRLVAENTVEEKILALQARKEQLADTVYREGAASAGALSEADIAALIAPV